MIINATSISLESAYSGSIIYLITSFAYRVSLSSDGSTTTTTSIFSLSNLPASATVQQIYVNDNFVLTKQSNNNITLYLPPSSGVATQSASGILTYPTS
jgi:hypothetical protein